MRDYIPNRTAKSPDRIDAHAWAITDSMLAREACAEPKSVRDLTYHLQHTFKRCCRTLLTRTGIIIDTICPNSHRSLQTLQRGRRANITQTSRITAAILINSYSSLYAFSITTVATFAMSVITAC